MKTQKYKCFLNLVTLINFQFFEQTYRNETSFQFHLICFVSFSVLQRMSSAVNTVLDKIVCAKTSINPADRCISILPYSC